MSERIRGSYKSMCTLVKGCHSAWRTISGMLISRSVANDTSLLRGQCKAIPTVTFQAKQHCHGFLASTQFSILPRIGGWDGLGGRTCCFAASLLCLLDCVCVCVCVCRTTVVWTGTRWCFWWRLYHHAHWMLRVCIANRRRWPCRCETVFFHSLLVFSC